MITGFDYGTSNCAIAAVTPSGNNSRDMADISLVPLEQGKVFIPSTLYALERELIVDVVGQQLKDGEVRQAFIATRQNQLAQAQRVRLEEDIAKNEQALFFGREAFARYIAQPDEGYFVKSPKSFLGSSGFRPAFIHFFEDIVTAMMQNIKHQAELSLGQGISHTVIGKPVNFQGINAEKSNTQALSILTTAAKRAGFKSVEFLYEPIAAGLAFEHQLLEDKTVLVVDIGGGTTDCAMVRMGPSYRHNIDRKDDFLGHTGERVGGNDLDIQLAGKCLMPLFGMNSELENGLPMPTQMFWNAVTTNDVSAQTEFNSMPTQIHIEQMLRDAKYKNLLQRFIHLREDKQNFHLVREAEQAKIALSTHLHHHVLLDYIEADLACDISRTELSNAIQSPLTKILSLIDNAIKQAGEKPDLVFVTGGSAQSPVIRAAIAERLGDIEILDGDHFGSVASGLGMWASNIYA